MFTGLVEEAGEVVSVKRGKKSTELTVRAATVHRGLRKGASLAVNGACLTTVRKRGALPWLRRAGGNPPRHQSANTSALAMW